jgi:hypothetical protein
MAICFAATLQVARLIAALQGKNGQRRTFREFEPACPSLSPHRLRPQPEDRHACRLVAGASGGRLTTGAPAISAE